MSQEETKGHFMIIIWLNGFLQRTLAGNLAVFTGIRTFGSPVVGNMEEKAEV